MAGRPVIVLLSSKTCRLPDSIPILNSLNQPANSTRKLWKKREGEKEQAPIYFCILISF